MNSSHQTDTYEARAWSEAKITIMLLINCWVSTEICGMEGSQRHSGEASRVHQALTDQDLPRWRRGSVQKQWHLYCVQEINCPCSKATQLSLLQFCFDLLESLP